MRILVCDDKPSQCDRTMQAIGERGEVTPLAGVGMKEALKGLFEGISQLLNGNGKSDQWECPAEFRDYDVAIVDNDLTVLELEGARLTAETIIGYLRAFTEIPYIVSLNKNLHVDFDLRYLFGDYQSLADLALNTKHLRNGRLWEAEATEEFSPWYWPRLAEAADRRREQVRFLESRFEEPVWKAMGFPVEAEEYLSLRAKSPLSSTGLDAREASFAVFFEGSRTLPPSEIEKLKDLALKKADFARKAVRRITAYEVDRWLRRDVLGTQDVLIDLAHLVAQMPFLLGGKAGDLGCWNEVIACRERPFGLDGPLFEAHLEPARFEHWMWVPGPCFWWPALKANEVLTERFFEAEGDWPDAVFCEDASRFVSVTVDADAESLKEFQAEIEGSWARRYIVEAGEYLYSPRSRILGGVT
ncbi:MAG: hypothetical protein OXH09_05290 [Gammaproteobacteria bacterium]|nr:hypothetical protein [Gammaproteobacteria bacterium]